MYNVSIIFPVFAPPLRGESWVWSESEGDSGTLCGTGQLSTVSGQSAPQQRTGELLNLAAANFVQACSY